MINTLIFFIFSFILLIIIFQKRNRIFSFVGITLITMIFVLNLNYIGELSLLFLGIDRNSTLESNSFLLLSIYSVSIYFIVYIFNNEKVIKIKFLDNQITNDSIIFTGNMLVFLAVISLVIYSINVGGLLILKSASYSERYTSNEGLGLLTFFIKYFTIGFAMSFLAFPNKIRWRKFFILGVLIGIFTYLVMGGFRQLLMLHIIVFLIIGYYFKYIKLKQLILFFPIAILLFAMLALFRYGENSNDSMIQLLFFTIDSFAPFKSFPNIIDYFDKHEFIYFDSFIQEFLTLIPRFIWSEKPSIMMNSANFITYNVLNYENGVSISPTFYGSFYLIYGYESILIGVLISSLFFLLMDKLFFNNVKYYIYNINFSNNATFSSIFSVSIYLYFLITPLGFVRDGFEVIVKNILFNLIVITFLILLIIVFQKILPKKGKLTKS